MQQINTLLILTSKVRVLFSAGKPLLKSSQGEYAWKGTVLKWEMFREKVNSSAYIINNIQTTDHRYNPFQIVCYSQETCPLQCRMYDVNSGEQRQKGTGEDKAPRKKQPSFSWDDNTLKATA